MSKGIKPKSRVINLIGFGIVLLLRRKIDVTRFLSVLCNAIAKKREKTLQYGVLITEEKAKNDLFAWQKVCAAGRGFLEKARLDVAQEKIVCMADQVCADGIWLLGNKYAVKDNLVDFLLDPASGYKWGTSVLGGGVAEEFPLGVEIKGPWEISRCYHFLLLGEAYALTKDEKYAKIYKQQLLCWIKSNPYGYGPNWVCSMEVGIRIVNWLVGLLYFYSSPALDDSFLCLLLVSVEEHGRHIMANLENKNYFPNNHYIANIASLYFLAILCPLLKSSKKWRKFAKKELENEIVKQTDDNGWDYEYSVPYHRLVTEMFYYVYLLGQSFGDDFSIPYWLRLLKMVNCMERVGKPDGMLPQLGDNDSGRFLVFNCQWQPKSLDIGYCRDWKNKIKQGQVISGKGKALAFSDSGFYVFRSKNMYLVVVAQKRAPYRSNGHAHNDLLSVVLNVCGKDVFIDPGTYTYTRSIHDRNAFRSVKNHNVLYWENVEQNALTDDPFTLRERGGLVVEKTEIGPSVEKWTGCYCYSNRFHRREICFDKVREEIFIKDTCSHPNARLAFMCGLGMLPEVKAQKIEVGPIEVFFEGAVKIETEMAEYSPAYGEKVPVTKIVVYLENKGISTRMVIARKKEEKG